METNFTVTAAHHDSPPAPGPQAAYRTNPNELYSPAPDHILMAQQQGFYDYYGLPPGMGMGIGMGMGMGMPMQMSVTAGPPWAGNLAPTFAAPRPKALDEEIAAYAAENYPELDAGLLDLGTTAAGEKGSETDGEDPDSQSDVEGDSPPSQPAPNPNLRGKSGRLRATLAQLLQLLEDNDFAIGETFVEALNSIWNRASMLTVLNDSIAAVLTKSASPPPEVMPVVTIEHLESNQPLFSEAMQRALFRYWMQRFVAFGEKEMALKAQNAVGSPQAKPATTHTGAAILSTLPEGEAIILKEFPIFTIAALLTLLLHTGRIAGPDPFLIATTLLNLTDVMRSLRPLLALSFFIVHEKDRTRLHSFFVSWRDRIREAGVLQDSDSHTTPPPKVNPSPRHVLVHHHIFRSDIYKVVADFPLVVGQPVIVEGDTGEDFGYVKRVFAAGEKVPACYQPCSWKEPARQSKKKVSLRTTNGKKKKSRRWSTVLRPATEAEVAASEHMRTSDAWFLPRLQWLINKRGWEYDGFQLVGAQFQFDKRKLYVFYSNMTSADNNSREFPREPLLRAFYPAFQLRIWLHAVDPQAVPQRVMAVARKVTAKPVKPKKLTVALMEATERIKSTTPAKSAPLQPPPAATPMMPTWPTGPMMMGGGPEYPTHLMDDGEGYEYGAEEYWGYQAAMGMGMGMGMDGFGQPMQVQVGVGEWPPLQVPVAPGGGVSIPFPAGWNLAAPDGGPGNGAFVARPPGFPSIVVGRPAH